MTTRRLAWPGARRPLHHALELATTTVKVWRDGACEMHHRWVGHAATGRWRRLTGGARFVSGVWLTTAPRSCGRSTALSSARPRWAASVNCAAALPDGVHAVVGTWDACEVRLYHVDGPRSSTPSRAHTGACERGGGDARRPAHHQRLDADGRVKVWSVATKSLVSTCAGHDGGVGAVAAMPDGQRILSGGDGATVRV